ncbi:MAG: hypothetical protein IJI14_08890 [Anaerolineaceae bacterium]|nr:hypothetical protein [Anaerolineaceae bacterium]
MVSNKNLTTAQKNKKDEFYTKYETIEKEIPFYKNFIKGKNIYCNCDDPDKSSFWKYFSNNFDDLQLKSLTATFFSPAAAPVKKVIRRLNSGSKIVESLKLKGDGDFRSEETLDILQAPDTVAVTNPPFSLLKEYIPLMYEKRVPFLILANQNALTFKDVYPHLFSGDVLLGVSIHSGDVEFEIPEEYDTSGLNTVIKNGKKFTKVTGIRWLTNIDHGYYPKRMELNTIEWNLKKNVSLIKKLKEKYGTEQYPMYDNFPAIEVPLTSGIPSDFEGTIGIPITFLDKYNPNQFRFVGFRKGNDGKDLHVGNKKIYFRFLVQRCG